MKRQQRIQIAAIVGFAAVLFWILGRGGDTPAPTPSLTPTAAPTVAASASPAAARVARASPSPAAPASPPSSTGPTASNPTPEETEDAEPSHVLIAKQRIPRHTRFYPNNVGVYLKRVPETSDLRLRGVPVREFEDAIGLVVKDEMKAVTPLTSRQLISPARTGRFAVAVPHGKRAITITMDRLQGVAGFVNQGDLVDVFHHLNIAGERHTYLLLQTMPVLSVDRVYVFKDAKGRQKLTARPPAPEGQEKKGGPPRDRVVAGELSTVTFAATPAQASRLVQAGNVAGKLSLSLRGPEDTEILDLSPISDSILYDPRQRPADSRILQEIEVYRGSRRTVKAVEEIKEGYDIPEDILILEPGS